MKNNTLQRNNTLQNNSFPNNQLLCNWLERERNGYQGFTEAGIKKAWDFKAGTNTIQS